MGESLSVHPDFYASLVFNSSDLISIINSEGIYSYVSNSAETILGYKPEDLVGKSAFGFIHPEEIPLAFQALQNLNNTDSLHVPPFRFKAKNGEWRWMDCMLKDMTANANVNGIVSNARDVTERIEAEHRLEMSEAYYSSLFFNHPDAVFALNAKGIFETINLGVEEVIGYPKSEIIGRHYLDFLVSSSIPTANEAFFNALNGQPNKHEVLALHKNTEEISLSITAVPIILNGKVVGVHGIAKDVTEIKKAQITIKDQAELLNSVFGSITDSLFVVDKQWQITYANPVFANFSGLSEADLLGKQVWEVLPELKSTRFYEVCLQVASSGNSVHLDQSFPERRQALAFAIYPLSGGLTIFFKDITERKKKEQELFELSLVASKTTNGVVIMDPEGKIEWVNDGFCRLTGYSREEAVGQVPSKLLQGPATNPEDSARIYQNYRDRVPFSQEVLNYKKNGEILWFHIDITPVFDEQGNFMKYIAIENDITELKKKEAERVRLTENLMRRNQDLQQFTYIVSHNLRAPVANLVGLSNLLNHERKDSAKFDQALTKFTTAASRLDSVITDLSKILSPLKDAGLETEEKVNVYEVVNEVAAALQEQLESVNAQFENNLTSTLILSGRYAYFYSIFNNLISNAIKYSAPERPLKISIRQQESPGKISILFSDNGIGMDLGTIKDQLFQLYKRFHPGTEGRGIGLYLVKTQVEAIGGTITAESTPGQGTTFFLTFGL